MDYDSLNTTDFIQKAQEGDQESFGEIFETFVAPVYRFVLFRVADIPSAEKLTEEIFLRIWKDLKKFRPHGRVSFAVWIFQLAHSVVTQFLKQLKKSSAARREFLNRQKQDAENPERQEERKLQKFFNMLPSSQAESVILKYFCNLSNSDISLFLEKTEGAVRILQSRGLKRLRELLEQ